MPKCPKCGADLNESAVVCSKCGAKLNDKSNSSKLIIGIVALVVIIAIVGAFASGVFTGNDATVDTENSSDEIVKPIVEDDANDSSSNTEYWASAKAEKFHLPTCEWAQKISEDNKIVYDSRDKAIADGKIPCSACNP